MNNLFTSFPLSLSSTPMSPPPPQINDLFFIVIAQIQPMLLRTGFRDDHL